MLLQLATKMCTTSMMHLVLQWTVIWRLACVTLALHVVEDVPAAAQV